MIRLHLRPLATLLLASIAGPSVSLHAKTVIDFETLGATLAPDSAYIGADMAGGFSSQGATFSNSYAVDPDFGPFWSGNAYANKTSFSAGRPFQNNHDTAVAPETGVNGSATWGIAFTSAAVITAPNGAFFDSLYVTNTRTAQELLLNGNQFSRPFGGDSGDLPDLFTVRFTDLSPGGSGFVEFILADYRFSDNNQDYIVDNWQLVDLTPLNQATSIGIEFTSTDEGPFGINTPTYVAMDDIAFGSVAVPEPSSMGLLTLIGIYIWRCRMRGRRDQPPV